MGFLGAAPAWSCHPNGLAHVCAESGPCGLETEMPVGALALVVALLAGASKLRWPNICYRISPWVLLTPLAHICCLFWSLVSVTWPCFILILVGFALDMQIVCIHEYGGSPVLEYELLSHLCWYWDENGTICLSISRCKLMLISIHHLLQLRNCSICSWALLPQLLLIGTLLVAVERDGLVLITRIMRFLDNPSAAFLSFLIDDHDVGELFSGGRQVS